MLQRNYFLIQKRYGHVTEQMKTESANRMEAFIQSVSGVRENQRETEKPPLRIWKNPNFKSGEWKKKPQDSGESWVNLIAEDEGLELHGIIP